MVRAVRIAEAAGGFALPMLPSSRPTGPSDWRRGHAAAGQAASR